MSNYKNYQDFTKIHEGGLSKDKDDNASSYPVPDGSGYHTNKGITYRTFVDLSSVLKYQASVENFLNMPDVIFESIFKHYWITSGADLINDQPLANLFFQAKWGGGHKYFVKSVQFYLNKEKQAGLTVDGSLGLKTAAVVNLHADQDLTVQFINLRLAYLKTLDDWPSFGKGWSQKYKDMILLSKQYFLQNPKKGLGIVVAACIALFFFTPFLT